MNDDRFGRWLTSQRRVLSLTGVGTALCIAVALCFDSWSWERGTWEWGAKPWNNVIIPLLLAPPFFYYLLTKLRALSIAHHRLEVVASTDSLTSCLNRAAFSTLVEAYLSKFKDHAEFGRGALLVIDVDHFKRVNDSYGHDVGDEALRMIAESIRRNLRERDLIGRIGGEEFCVFLPGATEQQGRWIAERIRETVEQLAFAPTGEQHILSVSIGGAPFTAAASFSGLYRVADQRLYEAKHAGRNTVVMDASDWIASSLQ